MRITTNFLGHQPVKRLAPSLDLFLDQTQKKNRQVPRPPQPLAPLSPLAPQASLEASFQQVLHQQVRHQQAGQTEQMDFNSLI